MQPVFSRLRWLAGLCAAAIVQVACSADQGAPPPALAGRGGTSPGGNSGASGTGGSTGGSGDAAAGNGGSTGAGVTGGSSGTSATGGSSGAGATGGSGGGTGAIGGSSGTSGTGGTSGSSGTSGASGSSGTAGTGGTGGTNGTGGTGGAPPNTVSLAWDAPAANATVTGTTAFRLTGAGFVNVEIFRSGTMFERCSVAADRLSATCTIDTKRLPNGSVTLTAHGSNSPAGSAFTAEADAGPRTFVVNNSNSQAGFWKSGTDGLSRTFADAFGAWRGRPVTSNWINVHWTQWDWMTAPGLNSTLNGQDPIKVYDLYAGWSGVMVLSMSMAGSSADADYNARMRECASGAFDDYWRTFAQNATAAGRTAENTVVSLAHEFNGTWFKWNPGTVGLDVWKSCWRHVYAAIKERSTLRVVWVFSATNNTTKGGDFSVNTAWDAYPGDEYVDIVGINRYDFRSLGSTTNWRDLCSNTQDICHVANYARQHGKPMAVPEWSMDRGQYGAGDRAEFVDMMFNFFKDNADILAFENNFNNGGSGDWNYYPESAANAQSAARYKALWKQ